MTTIFPVRIRMSAAALSELHSCEYGSYEDNIVNGRTEGYDNGELHIVEIIERSPFKTVVYLQNQQEVDEFFVQACTGTFGLYCLGTALRIHDQLRPLASEKAQKVVNRGTIGY